MTTLKKYTLTDLKEKEIAVKLTKRDDYEILLKALDCDYSSNFYEDEPYYGVDDEGFGLLYSNELEGRILLSSIDEIDLDEKEELTTPLKIRTVDFLESLVRDCENKIARLKEENDKLTAEVIKLSKGNTTLLGKLATLEQDYEALKESQQSERTRMAWELYVSGFNHGIADKWTINECFRSAEIFFKHAKSKEVGNG